MNELEKATMRMALEALRHGVSQLNGIGIPMEADPLHTAIAALTQALATTEPSGVRTVKVRARLTDDFSDCLLDDAPTERKGEPVALPVAWIHDWSKSSEQVGQILSGSPESPHDNQVEVTPLYTKSFIPEDFLTHRDAWRKALLIAERYAKVQAPDIDDRLYWRHELAAFDRAYLSISTTCNADLKLFATEVLPRPLRYTLDDYHRAPSDGPLNETWKDKPHRLLYDLIAALVYYAPAQIAKDTRQE